MTERLHFHFSPSCTGEGNGNPLQCSCLENPRDGGAWWAAVYGVAQGRTRLKPLSSSSRWVKYSSPKWWQLAMFPDIAKCSLEVKNSPLGKHWCRLPYYYMSSKCIYSGNFPCPSIDDWIKKIWVCAWCVCVMEYYSVIQRKILFAAT